jgi:hypothetical protein
MYASCLDHTSQWATGSLVFVVFIAVTRASVRCFCPLQGITGQQLD